jgi:phage terminase large subunit
MSAQAAHSPGYARTRAKFRALYPVVQHWRDDPETFARDVLGHDPWPVPCTIMAAIAQPRARVAVKACHSSSKTFTAAEIVLWWVERGGIAVTTAPTWTQVKRLLWGEIHRAARGALRPLSGTLLTTEYHRAADCYAIGLSTNEGVNFQGFHGDVLLVLDEAPGVRPDIFEAIEGIRAAGDVRVLMLGNPTIASGPFYDAFGRDRASWRTFTIDAFDTPNLAGVTVADLRAIPLDHAADHPTLAHNPRPYLTTRRWVHEKLHTWGEDSPLWQARVRGQFPLQSEDALLSLAWLEAARTREAEPGGEWEAGIDVAGPGEAETVLAVREGPALRLLKSWTNPDPRGEVLAELAPFNDQLARIKVDSIGQGYYFARHIEDNGYAGRVEDVNVGERASDAEKYVNRKAELYWGLRLRAEAGDLAGLADETAIGQLAGIRYRHDARGHVVIESKDEARKRGVPSPDRAEAIMLCYAPSGAPATYAVGGSRLPAVAAAQRHGGGKVRIR